MVWAPWGLRGCGLQADLAALASNGGMYQQSIGGSSNQGRQYSNGKPFHFGLFGIYNRTCMYIVASLTGAKAF